MPLTRCRPCKAGADARLESAPMENGSLERPKEQMGARKKCGSAGTRDAVILIRIDLIMAWDNESNRFERLSGCGGGAYLLFALTWVAVFRLIDLFGEVN